MNTLLRAGLGALLGLTLVFGTALAIEYDDIFEMTADGASDEEIIRLIIEDGRGFELSAREMDDLRDAGVSDIVIDAMRDPEVGRDWLEGDDDGEYYDDDRYEGRDTSSGYSTSLDEAYGQGYSDGRTSLVFSFGYYYGPLSRYYYNDPFYYSFWSAGYAYSYWPSYYAYWYRPAYAWSYAYPYNYYTYDSFYCHTYYDPGYWSAHGYTVLPGYGRTVWDDGPRWRDGGIAPPRGGRPMGSTELTTRLRDGSMNRLKNPSSPPAIREAIATRTPSERRSPGLGLPNTRKPVDRAADTRVGAGAGRRAPERGTVARSGVRDVTKGRVVRSTPERGVPRVARSTPHVARSVPRADRPSRAQVGERVGRRAAPAPERTRVVRGNREGSPGRAARPSQEMRRQQVRERVPAYDRGAQRREVREVREERGRGREEQRVEAPHREFVQPDRGREERAAPQRQEAPPPARAKDEDRGDRGGRGAERVERAVGRGGR